MSTNDYLSRCLEAYAFDDVLVGRHMVFVAGPRQVGKTRLAKHWLENKRCTPLYFNWDDPTIRRNYMQDPRFFESPARTIGFPDPWIVFDEIHKRPRWRDILKGVYDVFSADFRFLVTGSVRLDLFRRSGDALVGRYSLFHMMPLSVAEALGTPRTSCFLADEKPEAVAKGLEREIEAGVVQGSKDVFDAFLRFGPFPEPFLRQNDRFSFLWHRDYITLLIREDLREVSRVVELDKLENMAMLLPGRIGSPLSMANLARDLEVAHTTVKKWLEQLRRLYLIFPVSPWHKKVSRGLKKEKKWYFLDWAYAPDDGCRLENMVATSLFRSCTMLTDMGFGDYRLYYLRTLDRQEIDFVVCCNDQPVLAVEAKSGDISLSRHLAHRKKWFPGMIPGIQVVARRDFLQKHPNQTWVMSLDRLLGLLI